MNKPMTPQCPACSSSLLYLPTQFGVNVQVVRCANCKGEEPGDRIRHWRDA